MPRQARLDLPGLICHVIARGIERRDIFDDEKDRQRFLERLGELTIAYGARVYAWCLLSNHFHLLVRRGEQPLSQIMRRLMTGHAVRYNLRRGRAGHLFQNRYKSIVVEEEPYFLQVVRYIHLNPVRARMVGTPEELDRYPFSGHAVVMGNRQASWQDVDEVLGRFGARRREAVRGYHDFVVAGWNKEGHHEFSGGGWIRSVGGLQEAAKRREPEEREASDERILGTGSFVEELWRQEERVDRVSAGRPWQAVMGEVVEKWGVRSEDLVGRSRERRITLARREFLVRAKEESRLTMAALGRICGMSHVSVREALLKGLPTG